MRRISIVGSSGSGKTTLARTIATQLDIEHLELDSIYHQSNWHPLPDEDFRSAVRPLVGQDGWVVDGNYHRTGVQDIVWGRADTIIWLDLPRATTMWRVATRSLKRSFTRQELWNGNRESWTNLIHPDPTINIVMWTWTRYRATQDRYASASQDQRWSHLDWIRLPNQSAIDRFVATL
jgi:adenylate kinase family enzyme